MSRWMIYGATGYTGALIARRAAALGLGPVLAGRNALAVETLGKELGLPSRTIVLGDPAAVAAGLEGIELVLNCAGPFSRTAAPLLEACLAKRVHYLDITGEIDVFEAAHALDARARAAGIVVCPGVGFDVIPTDCVAAMLAASLPGATYLDLGFDGPQSLSPGTAKTMIESIGSGGKIRRDGKIVSVPLGYGMRDIDFGDGPKSAMAIPWGDVATAYYTTGIPNVTVYATAPRSAIRLIRFANALRFFMHSRSVIGFLSKRVDAAVRGPSASVRASSTMTVWGEARDAAGETHGLRITVANPYALTVDGSLAVVERLLEGPAPSGSTTPARLMGSSFVLDLPGTKPAAN